MLRGTQAFFYHPDGLGSIWDLTDSTGTVARSYTYDSFGNILTQPGTVANPYTYTGREIDAETGLYHYRTRYYDPVAGRFVVEDRTGIAGGLNLYSFTYNNPITFKDPLGEFAIPLIALGVATFVAVDLILPSELGEQARPNAGFYEFVSNSVNRGLAYCLLWFAGANFDFRSPQELRRHWGAHREEFGNISETEYLTKARLLLRGREAPAGVLEKVRPNGDVLRYDPAKNELGVRTKDGIIRAFFKQKEGMAYWSKQ